MNFSIPASWTYSVSSEKNASSRIHIYRIIQLFNLHVSNGFQTYAVIIAQLGIALLTGTLFCLIHCFVECGWVASTVATAILLVGIAVLKLGSGICSRVTATSFNFKYFVKHNCKANNYELKTLKSCSDIQIMGSLLTNQTFLSLLFQVIIVKAIDLVVAFR